MVENKAAKFSSSKAFLLY